MNDTTMPASLRPCLPPRRLVYPPALLSSPSSPPIALPPCRLVHQAEACDGAARSARLASEQLQAQADELLRRAEGSQREADELER